MQKLSPRVFNMYSYDRTAAGPKAFEDAVFKVNPKVSPYERTKPEKAAKSFVKDITETMGYAVGSRIDVWTDLMAEGKKPVKLKTVSTKSDGSSYEYERYDGETIYYSYEVEYPSEVQATKLIQLDARRLVQYVLDEVILSVSLADGERAVKAVLSQPEVLRAVPAFLAAFLKRYQPQGQEYGRLNRVVEDYVTREMFADPDSSDEDELSMAVEGHMAVDVDSAGWSVSHVRDLTVAIRVGFKTKVEVLWPDDHRYNDFD